MEFTRLRVKEYQINRDGVQINLLGAEHTKAKQPSQKGWRYIERRISQSSLVVGEYLPTELERTLFSNPIWGATGRAEANNEEGINDFFGKVQSLAIKHDKPIACADTANSALFRIYQFGPAVLSVIAIPLTNMSSLDSEAKSAHGLVYLGTSVGLALLHSIFVHHRRLGLEHYLPSIIDDRRLSTTRALEQEAERRKPGSVITYIGPQAHVERIRWDLEHPDDPVNKVKSRVYRLALGLPHSMRIYRHSKDFDSWRLVSNTPTRP